MGATRGSPGKMYEMLELQFTEARPQGGQGEEREMKCPYCNKEAQWVSNEAIYGFRVGRSYMIWWCQPCDSRVGCHNNTKKPLGTMANANLRVLRVKAHREFDKMWQHGESGIVSRKEAYKILTSGMAYLGMIKDGEEAHIGQMNIDQCKAVMELIKVKVK